MRVQEESLYMQGRETLKRLSPFLFLLCHLLFQLIRLQPSGRSLALVLREPDVYSFLKYANSSASSPIYSFSLTYYNVPMEDAEEANDS